MIPKKQQRRRGKTIAPSVIRQIPAKHGALAAVRQGMAEVTDPGGTAYGLAIPGLPYSGKTGTVETAGGNGPNTTWFVAWAPTKQWELWPENSTTAKARKLTTPARLD